MDAMVSFVRRYLADAHRVDRLGCLFDPTYESERSPVTRMWLRPSNGHPRIHISPEDGAAAQEELKKLYQRRLFKASRYLHPEYGEIGVFVVSADSTGWGLPGYRERYAVGRIPGETAKPRSEEPWVMKFLRGPLPDRRDGHAGGRQGPHRCGDLLLGTERMIRPLVPTA